MTPALATGRVRFVGDLLAMVIADTPEQARDAAEMIAVEYDERPAVTDTAKAAEPDAPQIWPGCENNTCVLWENQNSAPVDDIFERAHKIATVDVVNSRVMGTPMEPRAALSEYDAATGRVIHYAPTQGVHRHSFILQNFLPTMTKDDVRIVSRDVGGGFGLRGKFYPESMLMIWACKRLKRNLKWLADRYESMVSDTHGRDNVTHGEAALDENGKMLAVRLHATCSVGAYPFQNGPNVPIFNGGRVTGQAYDIPAIHHVIRCVFTNNTPTDTYRGAGRPEAAYIMERLIEAAADAMGIDPVEIRRRNFIPRDKIPYTNSRDCVFDSGDFAGTLEMALELADWNGFTKRRAESEARGLYRGIGIGYFIEASGANPIEEGRVRVNRDGTVSLIMGTFSHGQGHSAVFPQIVVDKLGVDYDAIDYVDAGDTDVVPFGGGTVGSRSSMMAGTIIVRSCDAIIEKGKKIAAHLLQADAASVGFADGVFRVTSGGGAMTLAEIAAAAHDPARLPDGIEPGLDETQRFDRGKGLDAYNHPNGAHIAEVEIDPETGVVRLVKYTALDDNGIVLNPMIVHGQVHGGVAQGLGQAILENPVYDSETGQFLTGSFMDYAMPRARHIPDIAAANNENEPSTSNPLGVKGAGEGGCCGAPSAIVIAAIDALKPLGVKHLDMPLTPEKVWRAMQTAKGT
ncbi:MAG: xanthine dehydrogenase family protein molybdopterin-binding subunit [Rhodospirillales bacterium]